MTPELTHAVRMLRLLEELGHASRKDVETLSEPEQNQLCKDIEQLLIDLDQLSSTMGHLKDLLETHKQFHEIRARAIQRAALNTALGPKPEGLPS